MPKLKAPIASAKLETYVHEINNLHIGLITSFRSSMWEVAQKIQAFKAVIEKNELKWAEWRAKLALSESMVSRYLSLAQYYPKRLAAPKLDGSKLQVLSIEDFVRAAKEAERDGVTPESKVNEMASIKEVKVALRETKARKTEVVAKLAKVKKELEKKGTRTMEERQALAKQAEELEAEAGDLDPAVAAAESELAKIEVKRRKAMDPQDFFEALALIGINHKHGKWVLDEYAAMAFGFTYTSGVPTGYIEKKVWEALFGRLADVHKKHKAPKVESDRLEVCRAFFAS